MLHVVRPTSPRSGKRYLLINPPLEEPGYALDDGRAEEDSHLGRLRTRSFAFPLPIGLLRVANSLTASGHEVYFLDGFSSLPPPHPSSWRRRTESDEPDAVIGERQRVRYVHLGLPYAEIVELIADLTVDEVFVTCTFTYHNESAHRVIDLVKEHLPGAKVTLGGIYPSLVPEDAERSSADEVFIGSWPDLSDLALNYDYLGVPPEFILVKGTSGCPYACAYCAVHRLEGRHFSHRDPMDVWEEIRTAHERYGMRIVGFWDSNILMKYEEYLGVVLAQIVGSGLRLNLRAPEGLDYRLITLEIAGDLKRAGFASVSLALENVDAKVARGTLARKNDLNRLRQAVDWLKEAGFRGDQIRLFVIVGLPGQSVENVLENLRFVWEMGVNATLFPFTPIPGTPIYAALPARIRALPLKALHPNLFSCVEEDAVKDALVELLPLNRLNEKGRLQRDAFREVIGSENVRKILASF